MESISSYNIIHALKR